MRAYNAVKESEDKLYRDIPFILGGRREAYALTNQMEYFSELTECFFGLNDFYPFNNQELREYDPAGYAMMQKVWFLSDEQIFTEHQKALKRRSKEDKEEKAEKDGKEQEETETTRPVIERLAVNQKRVITI